MLDFWEPSFDADSIVVGAGSVGLTTAYVVRHCRVSCRVLEEQVQLEPYSRANNFWAKPWELLASIGGLDAVAAKSSRVEQVNTVLDGQPIDPIKVDQVPSPYQTALYSGPGVIETTLSGLVAERGSPVEGGLKVVGLEQDDQRATVSYAGADDRDDAVPRPLRRRYVAGANGNACSAGKSLGLDFGAERFEGHVSRQIDAKLDWRGPTDLDELWLFNCKDELCGVLPVWGEWHRLFLLRTDAGVPERGPKLAGVQALARTVTEATSTPHASTDTPLLSDLDARTHPAYALVGTPALVLTRSDGHIAFRGAVDRPDLLRWFCEATFGRPEPEVGAAASDRPRQAQGLEA